MLNVHLCLQEILHTASSRFTVSAENDMNGMTQKELEKEKMLLGRMCFELKAKRQVIYGTYDAK